MRKDFVVYAHYTKDTKDTNELFYIGEGTNKRSRSKSNRNRYWNFKVRKHGGFIVDILHSGLTKEQAENIETDLIKEYKSKGNQLVNFCIGPMLRNHWLLNAPKEAHPMFGTKSPASSKRITQWNKEHSGKLSPVYGLKRSDLVERNKLEKYKKYKKIKCIETGEVFNSIKEASKKYNTKHFSRNIKKGWATKGFHFEYVK